jgi:hypothetical protein
MVDQPKSPMDMQAALEDVTRGDVTRSAPPTASTAGAALWLKVTLAQGLLNTAAARFWSDPEMPRFFPSFLVELYSIVRCSVPLMERALERAEQLAAHDELARVTVGYLRLHIEEERHHDEWLLDDLVAAGMDRELLRKNPPSANAARLVGAQYCWIEHAHPAAVFGYLGIIEGNPPLPQHIEEIRRQTGYPSDVFRSMHLHAVHDVDHLASLKATIVALPLTDVNERLVATSAFATLHALVRMLEDIATAGEYDSRLAAAV